MRFSIVAAAVVAVVVGFGGTLAVVVAAARNLGADPAEVGSWVVALCLGIGVTSIGLSVVSRMPVVTAWSLAGGALIAAAPPGFSMAEAIGAFVFSAVLMMLAGMVPVLGALVGRLPASLGAAMLAGVLWRFVVAVFQALQVEPWLVAPLLAVFLMARRFHAASAPLVVIVSGLPLAWLLGHAIPAPSFGLTWPIWVTPVFSPSAMIGLGVPLFLVTVATQQVPGAAVLRAAGYVPPLRMALVSTGLVSLLTAPFGGYSTNLSSVTAALCTGRDAHPDPAKRWLTGPVYGGCYLLLALFGAGFASMLAGLPPLLVATVAGTALLGPLTNALMVGLATERERFAAVTAFAVTASGLGLLGLGSAFWGLLAGLLVMGMERVSLRGIRI